ncbi:MAG TPA: putative 2-aminoethylphosphonate ABC transporter ATP-binding protein [Pseudomonadales bacterium]
MRAFGEPVAEDPYLSVTSLTKDFGSFRALDSVAFCVQRGEFLCLLGPSGCGKTTLLRCIAGLETQNSGAILQDGRDIGPLPVEQRDFGIVFQSYALFPNLTVWDNISYGIRSRGERRAEDLARLERLLEMVRLTPHRHKYPGQLSGGEQQRVALVRALTTSPGLLLLDEPLSALDAQVRQHLRREIKQIQKRLGVTTIMVTHDQEEAMAMADRVAVMKGGRIWQLGTPKEIYGNPNSRFIAEFIGSMNLFPGTYCGTGKIRVADMVLGCEPMDLPEGSPVTFAIRPEHVTLVHDHAPPGNMLACSVVDIETRGATDRVYLKSPIFPTEIYADLWSGDAALRDLAPGDEISVAFPEEAILILREERG